MRSENNFGFSILDFGLWELESESRFEDYTFMCFLR